MIPDAYVFRTYIDYTIEHGPEGNLEKTDYTSVTFFYSKTKPTADLSVLPVSARHIDDPEKIVFVPGWNLPIHSSPLSNGTIEKKATKIGNRHGSGYHRDVPTRQPAWRACGSLVGKNPVSTGTNMKLVEIILERVY